MWGAETDELPLIGRDEELRQLEELLDGPASGLVLVTGGARTAKSVLLRVLRSRAGARGWTVHPPLHPDGTDLLTIDPGTVPAQLLGPLGLRADPVTDGWRAEASPPELVLIHHYQPTQQFDDWFVDEALPAITSSHRISPLLLVLAAYERDVAHLTPFARRTMPVGHLAPGPVRSHLQALGTALREPLSNDELDAYVVAARETPSQLVALDHVLRVEAAFAGASTSDDGSGVDP